MGKSYWNGHTRELQRARLKERKSHLIEGPDGRPWHPHPAKGHGHNESYTHDGCRCPDCSRAAREYRDDLNARKSRQRLKRGDPGMEIDRETLFKF